MRFAFPAIGLLILTAACGEGGFDGSRPDAPPVGTIDAGAPDAELPDAPPIAAIERIDWRAVRGEPLSATTVSLPAAELFGLGDDGFVLRTECDDPLGCTYTWHDGGGAVTNRREHLIGTTATTVSPDGRRALLLAADDVGTCDDSGQRFVVERGTLQLVDLATGEATLDLLLRSNPWSAPAFTPDSRWFFAAPIADGRCLASRLGYRSATAPFAEAQGLAPASDFVQAVDAHRWLAFRRFDLGVVDPDAAESFIPLAEDPSRFDAAGGWVHAYVGFADLAHEIVSLSPTNQLRRTSVERDEDWFPTQAFGRWVRVCGFLREPGFRDCRIIDVLGEKSPVNVRVIHAPDHPDDAILMGEGAFVFVGESGEDGRAVKRLDLATGQLETLHEGDGKLSPLGDGEAALLLQGGDVWLIEPRREELLAHEVRFLLTAPRVAWLSPLRQHDIALLAPSADGAKLSLLVVDLRTRRIAQLTDHLYLTPRLAVDDCGQPSTTRHTAGPLDGLIQDGGHLFFVEKPSDDDGSATLWILPVDLSAPPRLLATLPDPTLCHAPLTSPSGERVGFLEDDPDTGAVRITVAAP